MNFSGHVEDDKYSSGNTMARTSYTTKYKKYSYADVGISEGKLKPTIEFVNDVKSALDARGNKRDALKHHVFDKYGHVILTQFQLGASEANISSEDERQEVCPHIRTVISILS